MEMNPTRLEVVSTPRLCSESPKLSPPCSFAPVISLTTSSPCLPATNPYDPNSEIHIHFPMIGSPQNYLQRSKSCSTFCRILI